MKLRELLGVYEFGNLDYPTVIIEDFDYRNSANPIERMFKGETRFVPESYRECKVYDFRIFDAHCLEITITGGRK